MWYSSRLVALALLSLVAGSGALRCWKCGSYSDGVGSITPCNNRSATRLDTCHSSAKYCIKYVSELTVVRDCVPTCSEKEWWGARTFCCDTDECNSAPRTTVTATVTTVITAVAVTVAIAR